MTVPWTSSPSASTVVAKNHSSLYRANDRGWVKVKNPNYWRRDAEREAMTRKAERRGPRSRAAA